MTPPHLQRRGDKLAREWVLACVDGSAYASSVCDHAGWFASDPEVGVDVVHAVEPASARVDGNVLVERALRRLQDEGVGPLTGRSIPGDLVEIIDESRSSIVVVGKRGVDSGSERTVLGSHVDAIVHRSRGPVCLAPKVFLPIQRALVLLDADLSHRAALDFVASDFRISKLPLDVAIVGASQRAADPKMEMARRQLSAASADVFPLISAGLDSAVIEYMQSRAADLIVLSRAVAAPNPQAELLRIENDGLWSTRAPILICQE
jgi:hypothetical protein